ncbi:MAG: sulfide/dihydroorotate dehydrogenase-like FAD/NAD-binding protein [Candidatus Omnitrophica bacterium]|nr:sulfide/dihydroorotate dehydrogenase-like FAD/NAD-binding protein [Candidatus Omnitrophota bacterium]MDD5487700.1 sulfide/dihydroorotate dehydrogenase-like FAD/NAD-binding protein [Candidatus Omnitrophota bacterium]
MHRIVRKEQLSPEICLVECEAGDLAAAAHAGQFVILRIDENGERFPLTLYDWDREKGTITVVCQAVGVSTKKLCALEQGDNVLDIAGPLGHAVRSGTSGKVICIGGGVGTAEAYPVARFLREEGCDVTVIIGARNKDMVICESDIRKISDKVYVTTDDGTYGRKGFVTDVLAELVGKERYDLVYAIGPIPMMKAVSDMTRGKGIKTMVSLNSIMIDGTGMCGGCRVMYDGETRFACVDGPEFDGHLVDFDDLMLRGRRYRDKEKISLDRYEKDCRIGLGLK